MGVPVKTPTGDWINRAVQTLRLAAAELHHVASSIELQAANDGEADKTALEGIADWLRAVAVGLKQAAAPF